MLQRSSLKHATSIGEDLLMTFIILFAVCLLFPAQEQLLPTSKPGRWESDGKSYLKFVAKDGYILFKDVQLEGKKRMLIEDFLRGYRFG